MGTRAPRFTGRVVFALLIVFFLGGYKFILRPVSAAPVPPAMALSVRVLAMPQVGGNGAPPPSTGTAHQASLSWTPAATQPSGITIVGTNVYRGTVAGGPYGKLNTTPVSGTTYVDLTVTSGVVERYIVTAVSTTGNESPWSNEAAAPIPNNPNPHQALAAISQ